MPSILIIEGINYMGRLLFIKEFPKWIETKRYSSLLMNQEQKDTLINLKPTSVKLVLWQVTSFQRHSYNAQETI